MGVWVCVCVGGGVGGCRCVCVCVNVWVGGCGWVLLLCCSYIFHSPALAIVPFVRCVVLSVLSVHSSCPFQPCVHIEGAISDAVEALVARGVLGSKEVC